MSARSTSPWRGLVAAALVAFAGLATGGRAEGASAQAARGGWARGLPTDDRYFPIAVWLQSPARAAQYRAAGINLYVGLWKGPTAEQLAQLEAAGVGLICGQNAAALAHLDSRTIVGWMHGDEPDNAQERPGGQGYGPPILPEVIVRNYQSIRASDPSRPVLLNLGQGVAWDDYIGRGVRRNHPEDYAAYVQGCDIASFDIYPVVHDSPQVAGRLEFVARGVERLRSWAGPERRVWSCIECTHIGNPDRKATPAQVRSEVWMALIRGATGLIYFVHQFKPEFREAALLDDPEMVAAVTAINREIQEWAPVLNQPTVREGLQVTSSQSDVPIAVMEKRTTRESHVFAVNLSNRPSQVVFTRTNAPDGTGSKLAVAIQVVGEGRRLESSGTGFADEFSAYAVHHYRWSR